MRPTRRELSTGDLKPANILVTQQGIKLLDFGRATASVIVAILERQPARACLRSRLTV